MPDSGRPGLARGRPPTGTDRRHRRRRTGNRTPTHARRRLSRQPTPHSPGPRNRLTPPASAAFAFAAALLIRLFNYSHCLLRVRSRDSGARSCQSICSSSGLSSVITPRTVSSDHLSPASHPSHLTVPAPALASGLGVSSIITGHHRHRVCHLGTTDRTSHNRLHYAPRRVRSSLQPGYRTYKHRIINSDIASHHWGHHCQRRTSSDRHRQRHASSTAALPTTAFRSVAPSLIGHSPIADQQVRLLLPAPRSSCQLSSSVSLGLPHRRLAGSSAHMQAGASVRLALYRQRYSQ